MEVRGFLFALGAKFTSAPFDHRRGDLIPQRCGTASL